MGGIWGSLRPPERFQKFQLLQAGLGLGLVCWFATKDGLHLYGRWCFYISWNLKRQKMNLVSILHFSVCKTREVTSIYTYLIHSFLYMHIYFNSTFDASIYYRYIYIYAYILIYNIIYIFYFSHTVGRFFRNLSIYLIQIQSSNPILKNGMFYSLL